MSDITIGGGSASVAAGLDDIQQAGRRLLALAADVEGLSAAALSIAVNGDLALSVVDAPVTATRAIAAAGLLAGQWQLPLEAVRLADLGASALAAVAAYRAVDDAVAASLDVVRDGVMFGVGQATPVLALGAVTAAVGGHDLGRELDKELYAAPWLVDLAAGGLDGWVGGIASLDPSVAVLLAIAARTAGRPWVPKTQEDALATIVQVGRFGGYVEDTGRVSVVRERQPRPGVAPDDFVGLLSGAMSISDGEDYPGRARVLEVPQADGTSTWVVQVPGTQEWSLRAGDNPNDLVTNLRLMSGESTALMSGVEQALSAAQAESAAASGARGMTRDVSAEPVLLTGHSQGGIAAAALASSAPFRARHQVTHVITSGAPVARFPIPDDTRVLSIEHAEDAVPRLDGDVNPDERHWVTVTRTLTGSTGLATTSAAHHQSRYRETARRVRALANPSVRSFEASAESFTTRGASGVVLTRDYRVRRAAPGRPSTGTGDAPP
ncbi:hypothetical protein ACQP1U_03935 [Actinomycetota bacterium]